MPRGSENEIADIFIRNIKHYCNWEYVNATKFAPENVVTINDRLNSLNKTKRLQLLKGGNKI